MLLVLTAVKDPAEVDQALRRVMAVIEQPIDLGGGRVVRVGSRGDGALPPRRHHQLRLPCARTRPCTPTKGHVSAERSFAAFLGPCTNTYLSPHQHPR